MGGHKGGPRGDLREVFCAYRCLLTAPWAHFVFSASLGALAACAPEPWQEQEVARVIACTHSPGREGEAQTLWRLRWDRALRRWERAKSSFAVLPWEESAADLRCVRDEHCGVRERCLAQRCWRSPRSPSELRRWFRGEEALSGAQEGWELRHTAPREIEIRSTQPAPSQKILAVYLGARWISADGHALGASLRPIHWIAPRHLGAVDRQRHSEQGASLRYSSRILCDTLPTSTQP